MPAGLNPSVPPKDGIFISGLRLYNALWDTARGMLMSGASDKQSCQDMSVVWLKPYDIHSPSRVPIKYQQYLSPLYCSADQRCHSHATMVTELPLPTLVDPAVWHQNRVFLATTIWTLKYEVWNVYLYVIFQVSIFQLKSIPWTWIAFLEYFSVWRMYVVLKWLSDAFYKKMWNFTDNFVWPILTLKVLAAFAYLFYSVQCPYMYIPMHV